MSLESQEKFPLNSIEAKLGKLGENSQAHIDGFEKQLQIAEKVGDLDGKNTQIATNIFDKYLSQVA